MTSTPHPRLLPGDDGGSASVVAVGLLLMVVALVLGVAGTARVLVERSRVAGAADASALAGADVAAGLTAGVVCDAARRAAEANRAALVACETDGSIVTVRVSSTLGLLPVAASATAGPPPAEAVGSPATP